MAPVVPFARFYLFTPYPFLEIFNGMTYLAFPCLSLASPPPPNWRWPEKKSGSEYSWVTPSCCPLFLPKPWQLKLPQSASPGDTLKTVPGGAPRASARLLVPTLLRSGLCDSLAFALTSGRGPSGLGRARLSLHIQVGEVLNTWPSPLKPTSLYSVHSK